MNWQKRLIAGFFASVAFGCITPSAFAWHECLNANGVFALERSGMLIGTIDIHNMNASLEIGDASCNATPLHITYKRKRDKVIVSGSWTADSCTSDFPWRRPLRILWTAVGSDCSSFSGKFKPKRKPAIPFIACSTTSSTSCTTSTTAKLVIADNYFEREVITYSNCLRVTGELLNHDSTGICDPEIAFEYFDSTGQKIGTTSISTQSNSIATRPYINRQDGGIERNCIKEGESAFFTADLCDDVPFSFPKSWKHEVTNGRFAQLDLMPEKAIAQGVAINEYGYRVSVTNVSETQLRNIDVFFITKNAEGKIIDVSSNSVGGGDCVGAFPSCMRPGRSYELGVYIDPWIAGRANSIQTMVSWAAEGSGFLPVHRQNIDLKVTSNFGNGIFYRDNVPIFGPSRGFNFVILSPTDGTDLDAAQFDTWGSYQPGLSDFIESIPDGALVLTGVHDEGSSGLTEEQRNLIARELGSAYIQDLGYWDGFALISIKGRGMLAENIGKSPDQPPRQGTALAEATVFIP